MDLSGPRKRLQGRREGHLGNLRRQLGLQRLPRRCPGHRRNLTDPDTSTGWYDSSGFENGDECAYIFGATQGAPGQFYNQVISGHHYFTQEEFSNRSFFQSGDGCLQRP